VAFGGFGQRHRVTRQIVGERHQRCTFPDLDKPRIFRRQSRLELIRVDLRQAINSQHPNRLP